MKSTYKFSLLAVIMVVTIGIVGCSDNNSGVTSPNFEDISPRDLSNLFASGGSAGMEMAKYEPGAAGFDVYVPGAGDYAIEYFVYQGGTYYVAFRTMGPAKIFLGLSPGDSLSKIVLWDTTIPDSFSLTQLGDAKFVATTAVQSIPSGIVPTRPRTLLGDIVDTAIESGAFNTLVGAVQATGLESTLRSPGPFTVFAPTDAAFDKLPPGLLSSLSTSQLKDILLYHVVSGKVTAAQVVTLSSAPTVLGPPISIAVQNGEVILNGTVKVTVTDVMATNGVIHIIDAVLIPPQ